MRHRGADGSLRTGGLDGALSRLLAEGTISPDETTVAVLTGHGLKASERIGELLGSARP